MNLGTLAKMGTGCLQIPRTLPRLSGPLDVACSSALRHSVRAKGVRRGTLALRAGPAIQVTKDRGASFCQSEGAAACPPAPHRAVPSLHRNESVPEGAGLNSPFY